MRGLAAIAAIEMVLAAAGLAAVPLAAQQTDPVVTQHAPASGTLPAPKPAPMPSPTLDDSAGTTDANAAAAAKADAATRKIIGDKEAYKASVDKSIADYDAKMAEYRRQVRENDARNAEIRRRNAARMALYTACVAGDKAACAQYNSGP